MMRRISPPLPNAPLPRGGFSLIEMIIAIVILGILAAGSTAFIVRGVEGYTDSARREQMASAARIAVERMQREMRAALPNSVRVSGDCIEFLPLVTAASYKEEGGTYASGETIQPLPVANYTPPADRFDALDLAPLPRGNFYAAVYPLGAGGGVLANGDPYAGADPGVLFPIQRVRARRTPNVFSVILKNSVQFARQSPEQRVAVVGDPVSFCVTPGGKLWRYTGYGIQASQPSPPPNGSLLAENVQLTDGAAAVTPFSYQPGTQNRNGIIVLDLRFMQDQEWLRVQQDVQIRNTP